MQTLQFSDWLDAKIENSEAINKSSWSVNQFLNLLEKLPPLSKHGPWIVGGTVRRLLNHEDLTTDFDIMFRNEQQFEDYCGQMRERGAETVDESARQITFKYEGWEIQPIKAAFNNTLIQTLNGFDFTLCQFGFDGTNLVWGDNSMEHVKEGKLVFLNTTDYVASMRRMFKYAKQGFFMDQTSVAKFLKKATENRERLEASEKLWEAEAKASGGFRSRWSGYSGG